MHLVFHGRRRVGSASHLDPHIEESDPAYEDLGSGKCNHRKRRPLEGDQRIDPEREPPEDERPRNLDIVHERQPSKRSEQYRREDREDDSDWNRGDDGKQKAPPPAAPPFVEDKRPDCDGSESEEERETVKAGLEHRGSIFHPRESWRQAPVDARGSLEIRDNAKAPVSGGFLLADDGTRTHDLLHGKQTL
jgi:hypothetical protein